MSVTTNAAPNELNTARLLRLTAAVPAAISTMSGQLVGLCGGSSYNYVITPSLLANSYIITAPSGSVVTSASNLSNATNNVLATADLTYTITYPAGFVATVALPKTISIASVNGVGTSLTSRSFNLSTLVPNIGTATGSAGITTFTRSANQTFTIPSVVGASTYLWTVADGAVIVSGQGTSTIEVNFSAVPVSTVSTRVRVTAANSCGLSSAIKTLILRQSVSPRVAAPVQLAVITTEVYPNPVSNDFNIDVNASNAGTLEIAIYSLDGNLVVSPKAVKLRAGANTITENVAALRAGVYILQLRNTSNNNVITKKLIKE